MSLYLVMLGPRGQNFGVGLVLAWVFVNLASNDALSNAKDCAVWTVVWDRLCSQTVAIQRRWL